MQGDERDNGKSYVHSVENDSLQVHAIQYHWVTYPF
jgi:hypothetical protein